MNKQSLHSKPLTRLFTLLFTLGGSIWLGASVARTIVGFDVFIPGTLVFKPAQTEAVRLHAIWLYTLLGGWTGWSFAVAAIGGIGCIIMMRTLFKTSGWLLMCAMLFCAVLPIQAYTSWTDYALWSLFDSTTGMSLTQPDHILSTFLQRFSNSTINVINGIAMLSAGTIVVVASLRPLQRTPNTVTDEG